MCLVNYKCSINVSCDRCHLTVLHIISLLSFAYQLKPSPFLSVQLDQSTPGCNQRLQTWVQSQYVTELSSRAVLSRDCFCLLGDDILALLIGNILSVCRQSQAELILELTHLHIFKLQTTAAEQLHQPIYKLHYGLCGADHSQNKTEKLKTPSDWFLTYSKYQLNP